MRRGKRRERRGGRRGDGETTREGGEQEEGRQEKGGERGDGGMRGEKQNHTNITIIEIKRS